VKFEPGAVKVARPGSSKQGLPVCICNRAPLTYASRMLGIGDCARDHESIY
jgi:hypothetical protein